MTKEALQKSWNDNFPNFLPIDYKLKKNFNERWFRIHTLPQSKRYPENEKEFDTIFQRHNLILSDLFGVNNPYYLLTSGYSYTRKEIPGNDKIQALGLQKKYWLSLNPWADEAYASYIHLYFDEKYWQQNSLNELFRLVANDEIGNVMLFSIEKNIVYHPYDGGADIIFRSSDLRDFYKKKYRDWLPNHPPGY